MKQHSSFTNSGLGRAKPKRRFHSFINNNLKRNRSQIGLVEDRTSSTTIVRIIIGLLMLHLVIIGGVLLKGHFDKMAGGVAVSPTLTPPPSVAAPAPQVEEVLPQPTPAPAAVATADTGTHITQPGAAGAAAPQQAELFPEQRTAAALPAPTPTPVVVTPPVVEPAPAAPAAPAPAEVEMTTVKYLVNSGDTWYGIAQKHGISIDTLKAANPTAARKNHLYQGSYLNVPVKADSAAAQAAATAAPAEEAAATYTVKRGDTLAKIARKHKMSVPALMKLNGLTDKDARRIKIGQELKVGK